MQCVFSVGDNTVNYCFAKNTCAKREYSKLKKTKQQNEELYLESQKQYKIKIFLKVIKFLFFVTFV